MGRVHGADIPSLIAELDENVERAGALVLGLGTAQFNWAPEPGRWSIAQCISHLNAVKGADIEPLTRSIASGIPGIGPFRYGSISLKFVASQEPPVTKKFKAPKVYTPAEQGDPGKEVSEFLRISGEIRGLMKRSASLDLARTKTAIIALPALLRPFIKMPLGARFAVMMAHDRRHLWQAEQVRASGRFP